jgi:hypothetical protein
LFDAQARIGGFAEVSFNAQIQNTAKTGEAYDMLCLKFEDLPEKSNVSGDSDSYDATQGSVAVKVRFALGDELAPGTYEIKGALLNRGNPELAAAFTVRLTASYPAPKIETVVPETWSNRESQSLTVYGTGFLPGTRLFLDDLELTLIKDDSGIGSTPKLDATVPAGVTGGSRTLIGPWP